jgi:hypothetical protein
LEVLEDFSSHLEALETWKTFLWKTFESWKTWKTLHLTIDVFRGQTCSWEFIVRI